MLKRMRGNLVGLVLAVCVLSLVLSVAAVWLWFVHAQNSSNTLSSSQQEISSNCTIQLWPDTVTEDPLLTEGGWEVRLVYDQPVFDKYVYLGLDRDGPILVDCEPFAVYGMDGQLWQITLEHFLGDSNLLESDYGYHLLLLVNPDDSLTIRFITRDRILPTTGELSGTPQFDGVIVVNQTGR